MADGAPPDVFAHEFYADEGKGAEGCGAAGPGARASAAVRDARGVVCSVPGSEVCKQSVFLSPPFLLAEGGFFRSP